jgi:hypothetical protein
LRTFPFPLAPSPSHLPSRRPSRYPSRRPSLHALWQVVTDDWAVETLPAWRQSVWVGVWDPWPVVRRPHLWWKVVRDAWCLEVMHRSFTNGLMQYGMMTASKA